MATEPESEQWMDQALWLARQLGLEVSEWQRRYLEDWVARTEQEERPCRLCRRPKREHGQPRFFDSEEDKAPFECNEVWRDPGSFSKVEGELRPIHYHEPGAFGTVSVEILACDDCGAVVTEKTTTRHAEWHERLKWSTGPSGGMLTSIFGGGV